MLGGVSDVSKSDEVMTSLPSFSSALGISLMLSVVELRVTVEATTILVSWKIVGSGLGVMTGAGPALIAVTGVAACLVIARRTVVFGTKTNRSAGIARWTYSNVRGSNLNSSYVSMKLDLQ